MLMPVIVKFQRRLRIKILVFFAIHPWIQFTYLDPRFLANFNTWAIAERTWWIISGSFTANVKSVIIVWFLLLVVWCSLLIIHSLRWRHNGRDRVSNHQPYDCLLNRLFRCRSKKTSKLRVTDLCAGNSPGTGESPAQMASYAENVSIWWHHHDAIGSLRTLSRLVQVMTRCLFCTPFPELVATYC